MHRFMGGLAVISGVFLATFVVESGTRPSGSGVLPILVVVFTVAALYWGLTTRPVKKRLLNWVPWRVVHRKTLEKHAAAVVTQRVSEQELGRRCLALANQLEARLAEHRREDPRTLNWATDKSSDRAESERQWEEQQRLENQHRAKLEAWFTQNALGEAAFLFRELRSRQLVTREDEGHLWHFPGHFTNHDIDGVATFLATLGRRLRGDEPLERS